jgi:23S rRNA (cytidine1920-2'-O)/16S rRNA (cytidine1409-2'-O)-methyltransferase
MASVTNLPPPPTTQLRLDVAMVERALVPSRERAQALIAAGLVAVAGEKATSAAQRIGAGDEVRVLGRDHPWASRGGVKLAAAIDAFAVDPSGRVALDAGASTGGFTDVLLQRGAALVYAVDVGYGQLDGRLSRDSRVRVLDRTNLRLLRDLPGPPPTLATLDLSFISLRAVLPRVAELAAPGADVVCLFKPQFEVGRAAVGKGGIVRDAEVVAAAGRDFADWAVQQLGAGVAGPIPSPIAGTKGNRELLVHLRLPGDPR